MINWPFGLKPTACMHVHHLVFLDSESWFKVFILQRDIITAPHDTIPKFHETKSASLKTGSNWSPVERRRRFNPLIGGVAEGRERDGEATDSSYTFVGGREKERGSENDVVFGHTKTHLQDNRRVVNQQKKYVNQNHEIGFSKITLPQF